MKIENFGELSSKSLDCLKLEQQEIYQEMKFKLNQYVEL